MASKRKGKFFVFELMQFENRSKTIKGGKQKGKKNREET